MSTYTQGFRARLVQRLLGPEEIGVTALSNETGVSKAALYRWMRSASNVNGMNGGKDNQKGASRSKQWTAEEKLRVLNESSQLSDAELGAYLRSQGIHEATLQQWRDAATSALASSSKPRTAKKSPEAKRVVQLERELHRKEKALAEMAALITLQKKVQAIWGDGDDVTGTKSGT